MRTFYYFSFSGFLLCLLFVSNFNSNKFSPAKQVKITCSVSNCEQNDSLFLFEFNGLNFKKINSAHIEENTAVFKMPKTNPRFYYIGLAANNVRPLIIGSEENITLSSVCLNFRQAKISNSKLNTDYLELKKAMTGFSNEMKGLGNQNWVKQQTEEGKKEMPEKYKELDTRQRAKLAELKKTAPYLAKIFSLNTYLSFSVNGGSYSDELQYFAYEYFQLVDWKDKDLEYMPWVYESMKSYSSTLASVKLPAESQKKFITYSLSKIPENTRTYQLAIAGVLAGLDQKNSPAYKDIGETFVEKYSKNLPKESTEIKAKIERMKSLIPGGQAPDFTMNQPDGTPMSLSDFRGKVTLVDFWASWCGPCRRENPHVVKLYEKYKDQGFDVLGVSLDGKKDRWLQAIDKDELAWNHVSDLKKWGNAAAKTYGVRSIPHTILLDREGKIIARGLRSRQLEQELIKIFGE